MSASARSGSTRIKVYGCSEEKRGRVAGIVPQSQSSDAATLGVCAFSAVTGLPRGRSRSVGSPHRQAECELRLRALRSGLQLSRPSWTGKLMSIKLFPAPSAISGNAPGLEFHERSRCLAAARFARRVYPGPLGELVARELTAYAEFGHRFGDGLIPRLVTAVLATRPDQEPPGRE